MADTLDIALNSILDQLDERFEVVIVDDGSNDNSVAVIKNLQAKNHNLRLVEMKRDFERQLGFTRNESIKHARGEYALLHLDCDDITAPHIKEFVEIFHQIENAFGYDILLSGKPIQMAKRDFLLSHGPYRNIHRGEDRDLLGRMAAINAFVPLEMKSFKTILPKTSRNRLYRTIYYTFDMMRNMFRAGKKLHVAVYEEFKYQKAQAPSTRILRLAMLFPAWVRAKTQSLLPEAQTLGTPEAFAEYREKVGGQFVKIMRDHGREADWTKISNAARAFFEF